MNKKHLILLIIFLAISGKTYAQNTWYNFGVGDKYIAAEWIKPTFNQNPNETAKVTFFSSVLYIKGSFPVNDKLSLQIDIPLSHWEYIGYDGIASQAPHTTLGNIYLGGTYKFSAKGKITPSVEIGTRLATMPEPDFPDKRGHFTGTYSSIDRHEAFFYDIVPVQGFLNLDYSVNAITTIRLRGGASYWFENSDNQNIENQLFLAQSLQVNFVTEEVGGQFGISGIYNVYPQDSIFSEYEVTQLRAGINKTFNKWNLEMYIRSPLDNNFLEMAFGLQANFHF